MKRTDKHIHLFNPSGCINESSFFGYLNHELNSSDMHAIEEHLSECLFCSDAMEGYEKQADKAKVQSDFQNIKKEVFIKPDRQQAFKKKDNKRYLVVSVSIAASFMLIISGYYLFQLLPVNSKQQELAVNSPVQKNDIPEAKDIRGPDSGNLEEEKSGKVNKEDITTVSKSGFKQKSEEKVNDNRDKGYVKGGDDLNEQDGDVSTTRKAAGKNTVYKPTVKGESVQSIEQSGGNKADHIKDAESTVRIADATPALNQSEELKKENFTVETKSLVDEVLPANNLVLEEKAVSGKKNRNFDRTENEKQPAAATGGVMRSAITPTLKSAIETYNSGNYYLAQTQFEYLLIQGKNNYAALYYVAMCQYNNGKKDSALIQLDKLLIKKNNPFYELAAWQKAQIFEESDNKKQAIETYREIIKNNGSMKNKAAQKVDELEK